MNNLNQEHLLFFKCLVCPAGNMLHFVIISVCSRIVWMLYCVVFHFSDILSTKHAQTEARSFIKTLHSFNKRAQVTSLKM